MRRIIFIDWFETWCSHFLWGHLKDENPALFHQIQSILFVDHQELCCDWMRGYTRFCNIWHFLEDCGIPKEITQTEFMRDLSFHKPDLPAFIPIVESLRQKGYQVFIVTDHFDIFGSYIYPYHHLEEVFDGYLSSAEIGYLKNDKMADGTYPFFHKFMMENNFSPNQCILIDNDMNTTQIYRSLGMETYAPQTPMDVLKILKQIDTDC